MTNKELITILSQLPPNAEVIFGINDGDEGGSCEVTIKMDKPKLSSPGVLRNDGIFVYGRGDERVVLFSVDEHYIYEAMRDQHYVERFKAKLRPIFPGDKITRGKIFKKSFIDRDEA